MDPQDIKHLIDSAPALVATRYFACPYSKLSHRRALGLLTDALVLVIGCVVLLWDHLLTFGDEIKYIWKLPVEVSKLVFLFNRYLVEASLCCTVYSESGEFSEYMNDLIPGLQYYLNCAARCPKK